MNRKIRLMFVIDSLEIGGAERLLVSVLRHLDKEKFKVAVAYLAGKGELINENEMPDVKIFGPLVKGEKNIIGAGAVFRIWQCMRRFNCDIVHTHLYYANIYGRIAAWLGHIPIVISTLHNPDYTYESNRSMRFKLRKFMDRFTGRHINTCFFAVSDAVRADFEKNMGFKNILTLHNGIDFSFFSKQESNPQTTKERLGLNKNDRIILNIGRLHPQKGQSDLIEAFSLLSDTHSNLKLIIAGSGHKEAELKNIVTASGLKDKVKFLGKIKGIENILKAADIFVLPSLYEGFGIAVLEAMASGIPVIATAVDGVNEIVENHKNGILVEPRNPQQIASAIKKLLEDTLLARQLADNAKSDVRTRFDIRDKVKEAESIYLKLIQSRQCLVCGSLNTKKTLFGGYKYAGQNYDIAGCRNCGFKFLNPMPSCETLNSIYQGQEYFENYFISENKPASYIQAMDNYNSGDLDTLGVMLKYKARGNLLDIGAAAGRFLQNARKYGYAVYGIEPNKVLADYARETLKLNVVNDFFHPECFSGEQFDIIYLADTLEHLPFLHGTIETIQARLKSDGILVLKHPLTYNFSLINLFLGLNMLFKHNRYSTNPPTHLWEFTAASLKRFLSNNNWQILYWRVFETKAKPLPEEKRGTLKSLAYSRLKNFSCWFSNSRLFKNLELGDRVVVICQKRQ